MTDKEFLQRITSKLTLNQYCKLVRIVYSFKKYIMVDESKTVAYCDFKDAQNRFVTSDIPKFFNDMAEIAGQNIKNFFDEWCYDNVVFWPYKEAPDLVKARRLLMQKCENHNTPYRFLSVFRENEHGEVSRFVVVNKCFSGSPLHRWDLEKYINTLWFKPLFEIDNEYSNPYSNHAAPRDYTIEHNTKAIIRAVSGVTNKEYKQYLFEITRPYYCTPQSYRQNEQDKAKYLFGNLNNITPYKFDEMILYRLFGYIHRYKKTIEVLGQPYHKAGRSIILEHMVYTIKHLSAEGKLKKVK